MMNTMDVTDPADNTDLAFAGSVKKVRSGSEKELPMVKKNRSEDEPFAMNSLEIPSRENPFEPSRRDSLKSDGSH